MTCTRVVLPELTNDGREVESFILTNGNPSYPIEITLWTYGATLVSVKTGDREGVMKEITLCYQNLSDLIQNPGPYFGATVGRYANRIAKGRYSIDGVDYSAPVNNGVNALHGGVVGFDKKIWIPEILHENDRIGVEFSLFSADGEEGYPGDLSIKVSYILDNQSNLFINYHAATTKPTIVNLTNHTYWNLSGNHERTVKDSHLALSCDRYLPVDGTQIPIGEIRSVEGSHFDFTVDSNASNGVLLGSVIMNIDGSGKPGLDHCFVVNDDAEIYANTSAKHMATLRDELSGRQMKVYGTQPGVQVYSANWLSEVQKDAPFIQHNGLCLETQHFPDSINQSNFPSVIVRPEKPYEHQAIFCFQTI